jgi:hypothetical protein
LFTTGCIGLTEPPEIKYKFLKPDQVPVPILDRNSEESENDSSETVEGEEDYGQHKSYQSLLHQKLAPSLYTVQDVGV